MLLMIELIITKSISKYKPLFIVRSFNVYNSDFGLADLEDKISLSMYNWSIQFGTAMNSLAVHILLMLLL